ncbi:MAG: hypothetical protein R2813_00245 [Flavobacteriales bacterium]
MTELVIPFLEKDDCDTRTGPDLNAVVDLLKERVNTIKELADAAVFFFRPLEPADELKTIISSRTTNRSCSTCWNG